jgi:hypothetical protein
MLMSTQALLIAKLERQAGAWVRAQLLRRYLRAARRRLPDGERIEASFRGQSIDFLDWATEYVEQLDPLSSQPRNQDQ